MSPPRFATNSDAIEVRPQFPLINDSSEQHSSKRAKMIGNNRSDALPCPPPRMMQPPPQLNRGTGHFFYKTRECTKFSFGSCRNGDNCNFAHGKEELRQPPPNWQELVGLRNERKEERMQVGNWDDDQRIIQKMKLCKKFYNGEQCPYGGNCSFLHEDPAKFRADSWKSRECSAISIGTIGSPKSFGDGSDNLEGNSGVTKQPKGTFWKTKLCTKWQNTGSCSFGKDCHFAHGEAGNNIGFGFLSYNSTVLF
jgi:hypothetical protein